MAANLPSDLRFVEDMNAIIRRAAGHGTEPRGTDQDSSGEPSTTVADFDGGARIPPAKSVDMNEILRRSVDRR